MKTSNVTVSFEDGKLDALSFHLEKSGSTVEKELQTMLQKLYEKNVPVTVRAYVERDTDKNTKFATTSRKTKPAPDLKTLSQEDEPQ